ncbi:MAG: NAD(P)/FAD-dependent oxidoreductase [Rhodomicrobium sp.]
MTEGNSRERRLRVAIIGAGFGGLSAARSLRHAPFDVVVIDYHNYHLFQPLLYQVATAGLSPSDIAWPTRSILSSQKNAKVVLGRVSRIDLQGKQVLAEEMRFGFDYLIVATGALQFYFGHEEWAAYAPSLKSIDDATYLRRRILLAFEKAETEPDAIERRHLLNFVVVGGGATGVEMAGAIAELAKRALAKDFRSIDPRSAHIILVEAGPRLLPAFDPSLSEAARQSLEQLGVEVRLSAAVTGCDGQGVSLGGERIEARTVMWAAGVKASPAGDWLGAQTDHAGRVKVAADLSVPGQPDIFVIGDTALALDENGKPLPGLAAVAKQQGKYVADLLIARARGNSASRFHYRDYGVLATIGRKRAVGQIGKFKLRGYPAWILWSLVHIYFLIGFRNRLFVAASWSWSYLTLRRGSRLITGITGTRIETMPLTPAHTLPASAGSSDRAKNGDEPDKQTGHKIQVW